MYLSRTRYTSHRVCTAVVQLAVRVLASGARGGRAAGLGVAVRAASGSGILGGLPPQEPVHVLREARHDEVRGALPEDAELLQSRAALLGGRQLRQYSGNLGPLAVAEAEAVQEVVAPTDGQARLVEVVQAAVAAHALGAHQALAEAVRLGQELARELFPPGQRRAQRVLQLRRQPASDGVRLLFGVLRRRHHAPEEAGVQEEARAYLAVLSDLRRVVLRVRDQRVAHGREVQPNLVLPPVVYLHLHQGVRRAAGA
mmetsp:Transcript_55255/g.146812  ORF Transcript_55255/g.146812 Transcript_55255/m.146812 type:complete len:256 (+) Transcript_55255:914-1681(+)